MVGARSGAGATAAAAVNGDARPRLSHGDRLAPSPELEPAPGQGGRPALAYGQFSTGAGAAGIGFGDATFGNRYGWYVDAMTRAISQNWLKSLVDSRVGRAPRVYLNFDIGRNGKISNLGVQQSSGIPSLDRSAQRAVLDRKSVV